MKIDFSKFILDLEGQPVKTESDRALTLAICASNALISPQAQEPSIEKKVNAFKLATRIVGGGEVDLTPEEMVLIKERISSVYGSSLIIGRVDEILNRPVLARVDDIANG